MSGEAPKLEEICRNLYAAHSRELYVFLRRFLGDGDLAEDVLQEVFISFYQYYQTRPLPEDLARVKGLLYRIGSNLSKNHMQSFHRRKVDYRAELLPGEDAPVNSLEEDAMAEETLRELQELLLLLPEKERRLLILRHVQSMRLEEMAEIEGVSISQVSRQIKKAERMLAAEGRKIDFDPARYL